MNETLETKDEKGNEIKGRVYEQKEIKFFKFWQGLLIFIIVIALFFEGSILIGKRFFWNQYDHTPIVEKEYQHAVELVRQDPNNAKNHVDLGYRMYQKGQYNEALAEYKKATQLDGKNFSAYLNLGLAYQHVGKNDLAISSLNTAIDLQPKGFEAHYYLGKAYYATGKYEQAVQEFSLAYKLNPGSFDTTFALAQTYEKMGNIADAKNQYASILDYDPKNTQASDALKRLGGQ